MKNFHDHFYNPEGIEVGDIVEITKSGIFSKYRGRLTIVNEIIYDHTKQGVEFTSYAVVNHPDLYKQSGELLTYKMIDLKLIQKGSEDSGNILDSLSI